MEPNIFGKVHDIDLKKTMEKSYIDYAMSVIVSRALSDVRDGLRPVQRRVLFSMIELNNGPDKPHRKCVRIAGDTMGKHHPHGDGSIYDALVNMAQEWSTRYSLVDGHGNFGSVDGDGAAVMRYTEIRLSKISMEILADIGKDTVDFVPNFDETEKEPTVLPPRHLSLFANGTSDITVGMATSIPSHNLREVIEAVVKIIDNHVEENRETSIEEILEIAKGPDFPTGATTPDKMGIEEAYRTDRGKTRVRAVTNIEAMSNGKNRIIVMELPYMVNKVCLIEKTAELVKEERIDGIADLRDEFDRTGMRTYTEFRRDVNANVILNQLLEHAQLQDTFGVIILALVNNEPRVLDVCQVLKYYLKHQKEVVTRGTKYDLNKAEERVHILKGLLIAPDNIDEVIKIIRGSKDAQAAKEELTNRFGLTDAQAQAIVDMCLRALTGLEREKLENEYRELETKTIDLRAILADEHRLLGVIKEEIIMISDKYDDDRRTVIRSDEFNMPTEDLIPDEDTITAITSLGYIKRMPVDNFKGQSCGGKGIKGTQTIEEDFIEDLIMTTMHHYIMFFTNTGRVYRSRTCMISEAGRTARGTVIINLLQLLSGEKITAIIPTKEYHEDKYLSMATKDGMVKKTPMKEYENVRESGLQTIVLKEDDGPIEVKATDNTKDIFLVTRKGQYIRFREMDVRVAGRISMGVIGMKFDKGDQVIGMQMDSQGECLLVVPANGTGKRTSIEEFTPQYRDGEGARCHKIVNKIGDPVGAKLAHDDHDIMLITTEGTITRVFASDTSVTGRNTSGVKLMNINHDSDISVASVVKVRGSSNNSESESVIEEESKEAESSEKSGADNINDNLIEQLTEIPYDIDYK